MVSYRSAEIALLFQLSETEVLASHDVKPSKSKNGSSSDSADSEHKPGETGSTQQTFPGLRSYSCALTKNGLVSQGAIHIFRSYIGGEMTRMRCLGVSLTVLMQV